jgi:hypothetical protein
LVITESDAAVARELQDSFDLGSLVNGEQWLEERGGGRGSPSVPRSAPRAQGCTRQGTQLRRPHSELHPSSSPQPDSQEQGGSLEDGWAAAALRQRTEVGVGAWQRRGAAFPYAQDEQVRGCACCLHVLQLIWHICFAINSVAGCLPHGCRPTARG